MSVAFAAVGWKGNFNDGDAQSAAAAISLSGLTAGAGYDDWLITYDGSGKLSLGKVTACEDGTSSFAYTSADREKVINSYATLTVTDSSGNAVATDTIPAGSLAHIRHVVSSWAPAPGGTGLAEGARTQADVALIHSRLAQSSAASGNLAGANKPSEVGACGVADARSRPIPYRQARSNAYSKGKCYANAIHRGDHGVDGQSNAFAVIDCDSLPT